MNTLNVSMNLLSNSSLCYLLAREGEEPPVKRKSDDQMMYSQPVVYHETITVNTIAVSINLLCYC